MGSKPVRRGVLVRRASTLTESIEAGVDNGGASQRAKGHAAAGKALSRYPAEESSAEDFAHFADW